MRRLLAGLALVTVGWLASPGAVPVYDGVGQPDEPYRYVGDDPAPGSVTVTVTASGGLAAAVQARTSESGPQALLDLAPGSFRVPSGSFTVSVTPLPFDGAPPRGEIDGNLYRVAVDQGAVLRPEQTQGFLFLRAAVMTEPAPVIVHRARPSDPWVEVRTNVNGRDNVNTPFRALGDYAVVRLPGAVPLDDGGGGLSGVRLALLVGGILVLLAIVVLVLRRSGQDTNQPT